MFILTHRWSFLNQMKNEKRQWSRNAVVTPGRDKGSFSPHALHKLRKAGKNKKNAQVLWADTDKSSEKGQNFFAVIARVKPNSITSSLESCSHSTSLKLLPDLSNHLLQALKQDWSWVSENQISSVPAEVAQEKQRCFWQCIKHWQFRKEGALSHLTGF